MQIPVARQLATIMWQADPMLRGRSTIGGWGEVCFSLTDSLLSWFGVGWFGESASLLSFKFGGCD